jgi:hypothetical protein
LDDVKPGLRTVLTGIIAHNGTQDEGEWGSYSLDASDAKARLHWIEVDGKRVKNPKGSTAVKEHTEVVVDQILPELREYFRSRGEKVSEEVIIIVAYTHAVSNIPQPNSESETQC